MHVFSSQPQLAPEVTVGTLMLEALERQEEWEAEALRGTALARPARAETEETVATAATALAEPAVRQSPSFTPAHGQTIQAVLHC
jgi:hypothetical protein